MKSLECVNVIKSCKIHLRLRLANLRGAFGGAVKAGASEEEVNFLPGFTARFFDVQETLNLRTRAGPEQVLKNTRRLIISILFTADESSDDTCKSLNSHTFFLFAQL